MHVRKDNTSRMELVKPDDQYLAPTIPISTQVRRASTRDIHLVGIDEAIQTQLQTRKDALNDRGQLKDECESDVVR